MKKTTNELKSIVTEISGKFGYFLNVTEVGKCSVSAENLHENLLPIYLPPSLSAARNIIFMIFSKRCTNKKTASTKPAAK